FAVAGNLDEVMLVIGHELGHVLSPTLSNGRAEEAKAFAFEMAWANAIFTNDIAGLQSSINEAALSMKPAQNGLHDLAFASRWDRVRMLYGAGRHAAGAAAELLQPERLEDHYGCRVRAFGNGPDAHYLPVI
ncbi:MAG: hypothetical protein AAB298_03600, partial [Pseudomonadota bacterium]